MTPNCKFACSFCTLARQWWRSRFMILKITSARTSMTCSKLSWTRRIWQCPSPSKQSNVLANKRMDWAKKKKKISRKTKGSKSKQSSTKSTLTMHKNTPGKSLDSLKFCGSLSLSSSPSGISYYPWLWALKKNRLCRRQLSAWAFSTSTTQRIFVSSASSVWRECLRCPSSTTSSGSCSSPTSGTAKVGTKTAAKRGFSY